MGVYNIIYGTAADNVIGATSTTYATARAMTSPVLGTNGLLLAVSLNASTRGIGNEFVTPNYNCVQGFIGFDTSTVTGSITSADLTLDLQSDASTTDFTLEARLKDWSTSVDTGDAVAGTSLSALPLLATLNTSTIAGFSIKFTSVALATNINTSGFTRIILCSDGQTNNTTPTTGSYVAFSSADNAGTTQDPRLNIYFGNPWAFVGVSNVVEVTTTAHALVTTGISGTLQADDLLVACIGSRIASTASITLPTGGAWTLVSEQKTNNILTTTSAAASGLMAYAIRGATDPNLTFTHPVAPSVALGRIVAYRNVNGASPKDTQTSFTTASTTAVSGTGLTTTQIEDLIVAMAAGGQEAAWSAFNATDPVGASGATSTAAPTTTWLERADSLTTTGADTSLAIFDAVKLTSGATGNLTATADMAALHVVIAGAFKIAAAAAAKAMPPFQSPRKIFTVSVGRMR